VAKPSWITWPVSTEADGNAAAPLKRQILISITPPDGTVKGTHSIIAVWTPKYGTNKQYTAITFKVDCQVASFTKPSSAPTSPTFTLAYSIFDKPLEINVTSLGYT